MRGRRYRWQYRSVNWIKPWISISDPINSKLQSGRCDASKQKSPNNDYYCQMSSGRLERADISLRVIKLISERPDYLVKLKGSSIIARNRGDQIWVDPRVAELRNDLSRRRIEARNP